MILKLTLFFAVLLPALASAQSLHKPLGALILGNALDLASTEVALHNPALREANPVMGQSSAQRVALKAGAVSAEVWLLKKLAPRHPKIAAGLGYSFGAVTTAIAAHNWRLR